jgi:hypothetical protein
LLPFTGGTKRRPGISWSGSNLIGAVPHQNFPGGHSQKLCRHHKLALVPCPDAKENPGMGEIPGLRAGGRGWGVLSDRLNHENGTEGSGFRDPSSSRRCLPLFRPCSRAGIDSPVFARDEHRTRELDKGAIRGAVRSWSGKLKPQPLR